MKIVLDPNAQIEQEMFIRQLKPQYSLGLDLFESNEYGKPTNRFGWLPVFAILGRYWQGKTLAEFQDMDDPGYEFALNVPLSHQEAPSEDFAPPSPGNFEMSKFRKDNQ